jgi:tetratricopeptide (TPR) repeat protein
MARRRGRLWRLSLCTALALVTAAPFAFVAATRPKDPPVAAAAAPGPPPAATPVTDLPAPQTTNSAAAEAYRLAGVAFRGGSLHEAARQYAAAAAADPALAAADLRLAFLAASPDERARRHGAAGERRDTLTPRDQRLLDALEPGVRGVPDRGEVVTRLEALMKDSRFDAEILWLLGEAYAGDGREEQALPMWERAAAVDTQFGAPLWSRARVLLDRGSEAEGKAALDRCLDSAASSAECEHAEALLAMHGGDCGMMNSYAQAMIVSTPEDARAYADAARAEAAVRALDVGETERQLGASWSKTSDAEAAWRVRLDDVDVALWTGDLDDAERALAKPEPTSTPDADVAAELARRAILLAEERGQPAAAAAAARAFLARQAGGGAGDPSSVALDAAPLAYAALARAGALTPAERTKKVGAWHDAWHARLPDGAARRAIWLAEHGAVAETESEARAGLAALPESEPLPDWDTPVSGDGDVGRLRFLAGDVAAALPLLARGAAACNGLDRPIEHARLELLYGEALEKNGERDRACVAYSALLTRWARATGSRTYAAAHARAAALACDR